MTRRSLWKLLLLPAAPAAAIAASRETQSDSISVLSAPPAPVPATYRVAQVQAENL
jgi:hypothetical protein